MLRDAPIIYSVLHWKHVAATSPLPEKNQPSLDRFVQMNALLTLSFLICMHLGHEFSLRAQSAQLQSMLIVVRELVVYVQVGTGVSVQDAQKTNRAIRHRC